MQRELKSKMLAQGKTTFRNMVGIYLKELRDSIIGAFEGFEEEARFIRKEWKHHSGGGGEISQMRGDVFEKAAVNWSGVYGTHLPFQEDAFRGCIPKKSGVGIADFVPNDDPIAAGAIWEKYGTKDVVPTSTLPGIDSLNASSQENEEPFFATGVSLITHMQNPYMPTVHFNIRYIETAHQRWFGGGYDLTPMGFPFEEDTRHFHHVARQALGDALYEDFSKNAAEYFYVKHWKKERGVGGIFFDHYNTGNFENDLKMWKNVGDTFLDAILPIYERRKNHPYTEEEKAIQNALRAHYVEFNLLYDRGTKFGFLSGGNPEAILCSMPPTATW